LNSSATGKPTSVAEVDDRATQYVKVVNLKIDEDNATVEVEKPKDEAIA
jgi:hypothetical protein